jgi:hypothetical protein
MTFTKSRQGVAHRMIDLRRVDAHTAVGWLEDDFHHFGITVLHDGAVVTGVRMAAPRTPWLSCAGAAAPLQALVGKPLIRRASDIGRLIEMRLQCTHVFDLAGLLLAHVAHADTRAPARRYHARVGDRERFGEEHLIASFGPGEACLFQDGVAVLRWEIDGEMITGPAPWGGHSQNQGFRAWTESLPEQEAEYATILRRAILVAGGRTIDHDDYPAAGAMGAPALCHSFQPAQRDHALRNVGSTRDYADHPEALLPNVAQIP